MIKKLDRNTTTISIASFHEQNQAKKFNYDPPYQRRSVWSDEKQSYLIDSILRNFPIPPIFLHRKIDSNTGTTTYDVIDGKQRLTAIARFINNEIPAANEYGRMEDDNVLDGSFFNDLSTDKRLADFKASFWKYDLPIEYVDPTDEGLIEEVFDRLNRNGEPLKGQELRNAQYHSSKLIAAVEELRGHSYFVDRLGVTDLARMEDKEFCSECLLSVHQGLVIGSSQKILDELYLKHSSDDYDGSLRVAFRLCDDLQSLGLEYSETRISGVSHLYGLWGLALVLYLNRRSIRDYKVQLHAFFDKLRGDVSTNENREDYKKSMNSRTKERYMRVKRVNALLSACGEEALHIS
ncbi:DUF262 domain-containing protein [Pseudomonas aeruginosa]|uniref:DUF262 domain-containing protein n=1 Tax=Pseudomonas aeruginosa TaxID=287 RepID=UPI0010127334|nr:DUF262 domain-containing protein [Pseudomonas aeruginosa]